MHRATVAKAANCKLIWLNMLWCMGSSCTLASKYNIFFTILEKVDKAPSPNGSTMGFYTECCKTLREDFMHSEFSPKCVLWETLQCYFHCSDSKEKLCRKVKGFQTNKLGGVHKIISKLITERLKIVMGKLVDAHQMAFLKGRQVMNVLLANLLVGLELNLIGRGFCASWILKNFMTVLIGVFFWKYSRIWDLVINVKFCISSVEFSVLINGNPVGFFQTHRKLRQGDPMPPFLFLRAMNCLNHLTTTA